MVNDHSEEQPFICYTLSFWKKGINWEQIDEAECIHWEKGGKKLQNKAGILFNSLLTFYQKGSSWDKLLDVRVLSLACVGMAFFHMFANVHSLYESENEAK